MKHDLKGNKSHSAIFTPMEVAHVMAQQDTGVGTVLDPTCGSGNLLVAIAERRLALGVPKRQIAKDLYGIELQEEYVVQCRERLVALLGCPATVAKNIQQGNFLE